ncbi:hypothetical protein HID58_055334 [Brassica napus]|uniref:Uncharacterized protein n=1 Tax=Brassica napus TaxID=3708 RepID=A0ABQ8AK40_BRANA|nr:hypothetical protein HID58_055334 [Brassica napus]
MLDQMGSPVSLCNGLYARLLLMGKSNGDLSVESRETTEEEEYGVFPVMERRRTRSGVQFAYDGPEIKAKIDEANDEIYNCNSEKIHIANRLKAKMVKLSPFESFWLILYIFITSVLNGLSLPASIESLVSSLDGYNNVMKDKEINSLSERLRWKWKCHRINYFWKRYRSGRTCGFRGLFCQFIGCICLSLRFELVFVLCLRVLYFQ